MLVLHVDTDGEFEEVYFGPFAPVKQASRHSARDNKQMIALTKLRQMQQALKAGGPEIELKVGLQIPNEPIGSDEE